MFHTSLSLAFHEGLVKTITWQISKHINPSRSAREWIFLFWNKGIPEKHISVLFDVVSLTDGTKAISILKKVGDSSTHHHKQRTIFRIVGILYGVVHWIFYNHTRNGMEYSNVLCSKRSHLCTMSKNIISYKKIFHTHIHFNRSWSNYSTKTNEKIDLTILYKIKTTSTITTQYHNTYKDKLTVRCFYMIF